jgi:photosystem II stability/assembly factor-like uncharacterized protein
MKKTIRYLVLVFCFYASTIHLLAQWIQTNGPAANYINCLAVDRTNLYAGTSLSGLYRSTDDGANWTQVVSWIGVVYALAVVSNGTGGTSIFAGTWGYYIFVSTDNGVSWVQRVAGLPEGFIYALAVAPNGASGTMLFAGTGEHGVYKSTDGGVNWTAANTGISNAYVASLAVVPNRKGGTDLYAGIRSSGVFRSTDNGTSWTTTYGPSGATYTTSFGLAFAPNSGGGMDLFAGTYDGNWVFYGNFWPTGGSGVYRLAENGTSWIPANTGLTNGKITSLVVSDTNIFAGTYDGGVYLSSINHIGWIPTNTGMPIRRVYALALSGTNLFAGTWGAGVWRQPLSNVTDVERMSTAVPTHFSLDQNYPNPFNPSTTISFSLSSRSMVSLRIFDALGREVSVLVSQELGAGTYSCQWIAAGLSSGVYFYHLRAGKFSETKKLLLVK